MDTEEQTDQKQIESPTDSESDKTHGDTFYISYFDTIDMPRVKMIMQVCNNILTQPNPPKILYFLLASPGGGVDAGIALYNYLKALPVKIIMHNTGSIDSIANVIFVAAEERYASPHATFLFHGVTWEFNTPISITLAQLNELRDRTLNNHETIAGIVCDNTKLDKKEIEDLFLQGETKNTRFALEKGLIHKVKSAQIPQNAPFVAININ